MMVSRREFITMGGLSIATSGFASRLLAEAPQTQLENMVSGVKALTPEDFDGRQERARSLIAANGMDALFLIGSPDMRYFTNVNMWVSERTSGVVLGPRGKPVWVVPAFELERMKESIPAGHEIRTWEEHGSPFAIVGGIMKDLGAAAGRLGLGPSVRSFIHFGLRREAPQVELVDGSAITQGCRAVKTEKEIAFMDLANRITKLAYREGFRQLREGMKPEELDELIGGAHEQMGVDGGGGAQFGLSTAFPHGSNAERRLRDGDVVMVDGGCTVQGYAADVTRTVVFGKPTDKQRSVWDIVRRAQSAALKAARPGVTCEYVDAVARKMIEEAGYGPGYKYFAHRLGHGIGMEGHEHPYLVKGNQQKLQAGMTFSDEPGIYIYGEFGVRIEDCFVVTEDGGRVFGGMESVSIEQPFNS